MKLTMMSVNQSILSSGLLGLCLSLNSFATDQTKAPASEAEKPAVSSETAPVTKNTKVIDLSKTIRLKAQIATPLDPCSYVQVSLNELFELSTKNGEEVGTLEKVTGQVNGESKDIAMVFYNKIAFLDPEVGKQTVELCEQKPS